MEDLSRDLARFQDGCLVVVAAIVVFALGFGIGYLIGRAQGMY